MVLEPAYSSHLQRTEPLGDHIHGSDTSDFSLVFVRGWKHVRIKKQLAYASHVERNIKKRKKISDLFGLCDSTQNWSAIYFSITKQHVDKTGYGKYWRPLHLPLKYSFDKIATPFDMLEILTLLFESNLNMYTADTYRNFWTLIITENYPNWDTNWGVCYKWKHTEQRQIETQGN